MKKAVVIPLMLGLATAVLLIASFPKIDQGWIVLFALVPWLIVLYSRRSIALKVWVTAAGFIVFFGMSLRWLRFVTWLGYVPLVAYLALYPTVCALIVGAAGDRRIVKRESMRKWLPVLVTPVAWVILEWARGRLLTGFPYLMLGHALHDTVLAQAADIAGSLGLTFLVVGINSAIAMMLLERQRAYLGAWLLAGVLCWGYGISALGVVGDASIIRIGVVQGNVKKNVKHHSDRAARLFDIHMTLSEGLDECDMIVWPETAVPVVMEARPYMKKRLSDLAIRKKAYVLMGSIGRDGEDFYNSAFLVSPTGEFLGRYDKIHLVPFGEFIPLPSLLAPLVRDKVYYKKSFTHGKTCKVFDAGGVPFSVLVCFEDMFPALIRRSVRKGAKLFINMTSEGWFGEDGELEQHLAIARMAAIENRIPIVRVANTGITAYIDSRGGITTSSKMEPKTTGVDVFEVRVPR